MKQFLKIFLFFISCIFSVCLTACDKPSYNSETPTPTADNYFEFIYLEKTDSYSIKAKDKNNMPEKIVIPAEYNGKQITHIGYDFTDEEMINGELLYNWGFVANSLENTNYAFVGCDSIKEIIIPESVTNICFGSITYCSNLTSITIPESVVSIGIWALFGNNNLTTLNIPDSVKNIGNWAFGNCSKLTSVFIGNGVSNIGYAVFEYCDNFTQINFNGTKAKWQSINKDNDWNCASNITKIVCVDGTIDL